MRSQRLHQGNKAAPSRPLNPNSSQYPWLSGFDVSQADDNLWAKPEEPSGGALIRPDHLPDLSQLMCLEVQLTSAVNKLVWRSLTTTSLVANAVLMKQGVREISGILHHLPADWRALLIQKILTQYARMAEWTRADGLDKNPLHMLWSTCHKFVRAFMRRFPTDPFPRSRPTLVPNFQQTACQPAPASMLHTGRNLEEHQSTLTNGHVANVRLPGTEEYVQQFPAVVSLDRTVQSPLVIANYSAENGGLANDDENALDEADNGAQHLGLTSCTDQRRQAAPWMPETGFDGVVQK